MALVTPVVSGAVLPTLTTLPLPALSVVIVVLVVELVLSMFNTRPVAPPVMFKVAILL